MERVLAIVETGPGGLDRQSAAALAMGQRLASTGAGGDVLYVGGAVPVAGKWDRGWSVPGGDSVALVATVVRMLEAAAYGVVVVGDTPVGRELAGRLASRQGLAVATSALSVRESGGLLQVSRPAAGGTRTATLTLHGSPAIIVANPEAGGPTGAVADVAVEQLAVDASVSPFTLVQESRLSPWEMDLTEADIVVAGGRGVGGREGFDMLAELAGLLGGTVGASRVAVDAGWIPSSRQVGLTGRTVTPALYIACGISGAIHHTLGMRGASFVVAINSDARAPIFKIANVSIVGDLHEVLRGLIADIRQRPGTERLAALAGAAQ